MALRRILRDGDPTLRKRSKPVTKLNERTGQLLDDLAETLHEANGVGLAAPQVGILKRLAVIDAGEGKEAIEFINPELVEQVGEQTYYEGCLSKPGRYGDARRPMQVIVRTQNRDGRTVEYRADGMFAVACCHEIDHLDGVMFMDKVQGTLYSSEEAKELREKQRAELPDGEGLDEGSIELIGFK